MLFSATQTKSIKDLARLSLSSPEYIGIHDKAESATPAKLEQHYMVSVIYLCFVIICCVYFVLKLLVVFSDI